MHSGVLVHMGVLVHAGVLAHEAAEKDGRGAAGNEPRGIRMPAQKWTPSSIPLAWLLRQSAEQGQDMSHGDTRSPTHVCAASCKSRMVRGAGGPQRVPSTSVFHSQSSSNW